MLTSDLFTARSNLLPLAFVWAIYIYIGSIEVTCRSTVDKIVLIWNLRWPPSCLCLLYFPASVLFTCIKSWFFRNHLASFDQISHWSYCWNVIDSLFKWSRSIDCQAHILFFKTKNCSNADLFISYDDRIGKMLHNICISSVAMSLRWASRGPWASCFVHFTGFQMDLYSFVIGPSDAQATSAYRALIAIISLSVAYLLKYFTISLT